MINIVFDLDDTLYTLYPTFEKSVTNFLPHHNLDLNAFYAIFREESNNLFSDTQRGDLTMHEFHTLRAIHAFNRIGIILNENQAETFQLIYEKQKREISLHFDTISLLNTLRSHQITTGIITNGEVQKQWRTMHSLQILKHFDSRSVLISGEVGVDKPSPEIYRIWESKANNGQLCFYIGDHFENDVVGSFLADWIPIWYNPQEKPAPNVDFEYYEIQELDDILSLPVLQDLIKAA